MGQEIRHLKGYGLDEGASSRLLVYAARLIAAGLPPLEACATTVSNVLTDDPDMVRSVNDVVAAFFGDMLADAGQDG